MTIGHKTNGGLWGVRPRYQIIVSLVVFFLLAMTPGVYAYSSTFTDTTGGWSQTVSYSAQQSQSLSHNISFGDVISITGNNYPVSRIQYYSGVCTGLYCAGSVIYTVYPGVNNYAIPYYEGAKGLLIDANSYLYFTSGSGLNNPNPPPVTNFTATPITGPAPFMVQFNDTSTNSPTSFYWQFGNGYTLTEQNPSVTYNDSGTYTISHSATNGGGTSWKNITGLITVTPAPNSSSGPPNITYYAEYWNLPYNFELLTYPGGHDSLVADCADLGGIASIGYQRVYVYDGEGQVLNYYASDTNGVIKGPNGEFPWHNIAFGFSPNGSAIAYAACMNGWYPKIAYHPGNPPLSPVVNFTGSPTNGTTPLTVSFTDNSTGTLTSYFWLFGDETNSTLQNPDHIYEQPGTYTVNHSATNAAGTSWENKTGYIHAGSQPQVLVNKIYTTPGSPGFNRVYTIDLDLENPSGIPNSKTISINENTISPIVNETATMLNSSITHNFDGVQNTGTVRFRFQHTADPLISLKEEYPGVSRLPWQSLNLGAQALRDYSFAKIDKKIEAFYDFSGVGDTQVKFWNNLHINLTGTYLYTFGGDDVFNSPSIEPVNGKLSDDSIIVNVNIPLGKTLAYYTGVVMQEAGSVATIVSYIPGCQALGKLAIPFEFAATCNFDNAVNPDFNYTEAIVPPTECDAYGLIFPTDMITDSAQFQMKTYCDAQNRKQAYQKYTGGLIMGATDMEVDSLSRQILYFQSSYHDDIEGMNRTWGRKAVDLESQGLIPTVADVQSAKQNISINGLPQEEIDFLKGKGYTDDDIAILKQIVLDTPDGLVVNYTSSIQVGLWGEEITSWQLLEAINENLGDQAPPLTNYSASVTSGTAPLTVQFTDYSTRSPGQWYWDFGDNQTSVIQNASHTFTSAGNYTVKLMATNVNGNDTRTKYDYISVSSPSVIVTNFTSNVTSGTVPLSVLFTDTSTENPIAWSWDFGDGGNSTEQNPTYTYISDGIFTVSLNATNAGGSNTLTKTDLITATSISAAPVANFTASPIRAINFNDTSLNTPTSWLWDFGDGTTSTEQNVTHIYQNSGTYNVTLTVGNEFGNNTLTQINSVTL